MKKHVVFFKKNLFTRKLENVLKVSFEMFREHQLGMMTFSFLPRVEDPSKWREAEVLLAEGSVVPTANVKKYIFS